MVPTWNYIAVHAHEPIEFFKDPKRLLQIVTRLTNVHEASRATPWAVSDAPADFIAVQFREIVGVRIPITMVEGKRKMSQNRPAPDRVGVATGLAASKLARDQEVAALIVVQD
ncbi:negative transcriptional regulator, PaiB family [Bradyrhizobium yuanmingense]|uniref:Negative transcriptional regulator, PaiB family n=1 Tax=Bradyrhizobium yuanmingense TaxID=108015 RepID=A0A1C3XJK9_9BRAD|nr:PaiB family negative transcriptional regulator [Bradyrhizobium yuanmingense]SCB52450.1 negative transcriptional regulator, PaiB family [Bradyrhizobium yuanmingense]